MQEVAVIVSNDNKEISDIEILDSIKESGFRNIFIHWESNEYNEHNWAEQIEYINKIGLNIVFAHLSYKGINSIWEEGTTGDSLVEKYMKDISDCKKHNISMVVMHLTSGKDAPMYNEIGLNRLHKIINHAKEQNVKVAFENTKIKGYLEYVIDNIKDENVGICYDSGHCHVHFNDEFDFDKFKDRIFAVHLHDNDKTDDLHLLAFDGTIDWEETMKNLKQANFSGHITLESVYRYEYLNLTPLEFYKKSYEVANKLANMYKKI